MKKKRALVLSGGGSKGMKNRGKLKNLTKKIFIELHWGNKKSLSQIAKQFGVHRTAIGYHAKKLNAPIRNSKAATKLANSGDENPAKRPEVKAKLTGVNNHFYGKKHTKNSKKKMSVSQKKWDRDEWRKIRWTEERKKEFSENNPMHNPIIKKKHKKALRAVRHKFSGENSSQWKGGVTSLRQKIRQLSEYKEWRKACIKKNGRKCQICFNANHEIQVDHIKPFSVILDEHQINSIKKALICDELWNVSNGRILCIRCHKKTDTFGGRLKNG